MKKEKKNLIPIILVSLSCILFIVAIILIMNINYFELNNTTKNKDNSQSQLKDQNSIEMSENITQENQDIGITENKNTENSNSEIIIEENNTSSNLNIENNTSSIQNEQSVISYFETQDNMITKASNQEDSSLREKVKNSFVTVVDFIFYDKEVNGYTFSELTTTAKLKVIKIALSIDHKIDEYFPNYKETIKDKYTDIKGKLALKYLEFTSSLCDSVGVDTCNQAKEDFNTMKESFGFTWELIKELASSGSEKVKAFYESWRDSK